jgi:hypothetical protein
MIRIAVIMINILVSQISCCVFSFTALAVFSASRLRRTSNAENGATTVPNAPCRGIKLRAAPAFILSSISSTDRSGSASMLVLILASLNRRSERSYRWLRQASVLCVFVLLWFPALGVAHEFPFAFLDDVFPTDGVTLAESIVKESDAIKIKSIRGGIGKRFDLIDIEAAIQSTLDIATFLADPNYFTWSIPSNILPPLKYTQPCLKVGTTGLQLIDSYSVHNVCYYGWGVPKVFESIVNARDGNYIGLSAGADQSKNVAKIGILYQCIQMCSVGIDDGPHIAFGKFSGSLGFFDGLFRSFSGDAGHNDSLLQPISLDASNQYQKISEKTNNDISRLSITKYIITPGAVFVLMIAGFCAADFFFILGIKQIAAGKLISPLIDTAIGLCLLFCILILLWTT